MILPFKSAIPYAAMHKDMYYIPSQYTGRTQITKTVLKYLPTVLSLQSVNHIMVCTTYLSESYCTV